MSNPTIKERQMKFNKLCDNLKIKLIKRTKSNISYMKKYIDNGEYLETKPIDSNLKNKYIAYFLNYLLEYYLFLAM